MSLTLMHEHVYLDLSKVKNNDDCLLNCFDQTVAEFKQLKAFGVERVVDLTNIGIGRSIEYVEKVEQASGMTIVSATGFYKEPFLPRMVEQYSVQALADLMISEITVGIEGTSRKAQIIGEIGSSAKGLRPLEQKVFIASAIAGKETGLAITTHTTLGSHGEQQINLLSKEGVDLSKVIIGHVDLSADLEYIKRLIDSGVNVEFDTIGKTNYLSDEVRVDMLCSMIKQGYQSQLFLSVDLTRKSHMRDFGGIGYAYLFENFIPKLIERGISASVISEILEKNPNRLLGKAS